jgi:hypothetical protein
MKKKEKIEALMQHIDSVLNRQNQPLKVWTMFVSLNIKDRELEK